jgi:hypothetical protein
MATYIYTCECGNTFTKESAGNPIPRRCPKCFTTMSVRPDGTKRLRDQQKEPLIVPGR